MTFDTGGVAAWAQSRPDALALLDDGLALTFGELDNSVARFRADLAAAGLGRGDRVAVVGENRIVTVVALLSAWRIGASVALINSRLGAAEIDRLTDAADAAAVISSSPRPAQHKAPLVCGNETVWLNVRTPRIPGGDPADLALILFTSGTTGAPKGVMLGHGNLDFVIRGIAQGRALKPGDRAYAALPITHAFGLTSVLLAMLSAGGSVRLVERFDAQRAVASFEHEPVSHFNGVPTMFSTICDNLDQRGTPFSAPTLRFIGSGGAPLGKSLIERVRRCMHLPLHSGYGMSEAGPTITMTDIGAPPEDENLGYPLPGTSLSVRDAEGRELPPGAVGELYVHSPGISPGYFRAPAQTLEVFKSGWLRTGDLGRVDDKGQLYLAGRSKDLIIRSGFNVYPLELETIVAAHPHVAECAVLGFPSGDDEGIALFLQLHPGGDADAVAKSLAEMVAPYKRPTRVIAVDKFETTIAGKVVKSTLLPLLAPAPALAG